MFRNRAKIGFVEFGESFMDAVKTAYCDDHYYYQKRFGTKNECLADKSGQKNKGGVNNIVSRFRKNSMDTKRTSVGLIGGSPYCVIIGGIPKDRTLEDIDPVSGKKYKEKCIGRGYKDINYYDVLNDAVDIEEQGDDE